MQKKMRLRDFEYWKRKRLVLHVGGFILFNLIFLACASITLQRDRIEQTKLWNSLFSGDHETTEKAAEVSEDAIPVLTGLYVENLREISLKDSYFSVEFLVWFRWEGNEDLNMADNFRMYNGIINSKEITKDYHENGIHYQQIRCDATISRKFVTSRFPLESILLKFYIVSDYNVENVILENDSTNSQCNPSLNISGYRLERFITGEYLHAYDNNQSDPSIEERAINSEILAAIEINRDGIGLYVKCFIALIGTIIWVLIALFICAYHSTDTFSLFPAALFGAVSNIMVGAGLIPDSLEMGLLEYVNIFGIDIILACTVTVININRIRMRYEDHSYAEYFGKIMFKAVLIITVAGNLLLPLSAYRFG